MGRIRGKNTEPEIVLRRFLWRLGLRFRINYPTPGGRADVAMPSRRTAIFVDGCFWHGCPEHYVRPRGTGHFWDEKLEENVRRDRRQSQRLIEAGWTLIRLWEHDVRENPADAARQVVDALNNGGRWPEWRVVSVVPLEGGGDLECRYLESLLGDAKRQEQSRRITAKTGRVSRVMPSSGE